jgi:cation transport ATPase
MNLSQTTTPDSGRPSQVTLCNGRVVIRDEQVFGTVDRRICERFLEAMLSLEGVRSVTLDRAQATAAIRHDTRPGGVGRLLDAVAAAIRKLHAGAPMPALPRSIQNSICTIFRHGSLFTSCEIMSDRPGRLRLRHETLQSDRALARELERLLVAVNGVRRVSSVAWTKTLFIDYNPALISSTELIRLIEECVDSPSRWGDSLPRPVSTRFGMANATLGVAGLGEFAVPALLPVSALLLVATNLRTFRQAWLQVRQRKFGLPVLYTVIVAATLASGQFIASALMSWLFRFWQGRLRAELAAGRRLVLEACLPRSSFARLITAQGGEVLAPADRLRPGDRIAVDAGETVPADGRILGGEAIIDERSVRGLEGASRKRAGEPVLAGSTVLAGSMRVEVVRSGESTRAQAIARSLVAATSPAAGPTSPTLRGEAFADRAVGPTLATAGLGLLIGDLTTVVAILRPDYATGPGLTVPLETLRDAAQCARRGIVICKPDVFERLAQVDLIVLEDNPALSRVELDIAAVHTRLPDAELLRYVASAFRHLDDDRARALQAACRDRKIHLLDLPPAGFGPGVTVVHGRRRVSVYESPPVAGGTGPLAVEIDGSVAGVIEFARSNRPESARALGRIRAESSVACALVSRRAQADAAGLASLLGVDQAMGSLSPDDTARFLGACRERGLRTALVSHGHRQKAAAALAHVAVSFVGDVDEYPDWASALLLQPRLDLFADLWEIAHRHEGRVLDAQKLVLLPNVFCVAGAFLFGFSSLAAVMISNLGTFSLFSRSAGSLNVLESTRRGHSRRLNLINQKQRGHGLPDGSSSGSHVDGTRNA